MLAKEEIDRAFDLGHALRHVDAIFERTLGEEDPVKALVYVTLKPDVLDPQGEAIRKACRTLGYDRVGSVRQGKLFEIELDAAERGRGAPAAGGALGQAARQHRDRRLSGSRRWTAPAGRR